jgi:ribosomal-protein-alanine N-acetyltransferase
MIIRQAELNDLSEIVVIEKLCFPEEIAFSAGMFAYLIRYAETMVAIDESLKGFIIGFASGSIGSIYTLDIHPNHRRKGLGSLLISALEEVLHARGAKTIRLEVDVGNFAAIRLYRNAGYSKIEIADDYYGRGKNAIRMVKTFE